MENKNLKVENIVAKILGAKTSRLDVISIDDGTAIGNFQRVKAISDNIVNNSVDYTQQLGQIYPTIIKDIVCIDDRYYDGVGLEMDGLDKAIPLSGLGLQSYCNLTGVNAGYARKCLAAGKAELLIKNFWEWHKGLNLDKNVFVRTAYNQVNALLSDRYTQFDDNEVLDCVYDVLGPSREYVIKNYSVTPAMLNLRIVSRNKINVRGDELSFGFDIKNSGIGKSSVEISIIIFRWICSNGLIVGGGKGYVLKQRHVAVDRESLIREFTTMLDSSPLIVEEIKETINKSMDVQLNSKEMQRIIDELKHSGVLEGAARSVEQYIEPGAEGTLWGVVNGITRASHNYSLETRLQMEKQAGIILSKYSA